MSWASSRQILALSKVFAPRYTIWKEWATVHLTSKDASRMITLVQGMTQNDLSPYAKRHEETVKAFAAVRDIAKGLGYDHFSTLN